MANLDELIVYQNFRRDEIQQRIARLSLKGTPISPIKYRCQRRSSSKPLKRLNDVYIGAVPGSSSKAQIAKCTKLLDTKFNEVYLHALGHSIPRAMQVAEAIKTFYVGTVDFTTKESTKTFIDDLIPLDEDTLPSQQTRTTPQLEIHIFRTVPIPL